MAIYPYLTMFVNINPYQTDLELSPKLQVYNKKCLQKRFSHQIYIKYSTSIQFINFGGLTE